MGDYTICMCQDYGYITLPAVVVVTFPEGRFTSGKDVADALFVTCDLEQGNAVMPLNAYGAPHQPLRGRDRWDVTQAFDMTTFERFDVEMTKDWARFYLRPAKQTGATREELEGQPLTCANVVDLTCQLTGGIRA